ncbi:hypothetical protein GYMLUDRAFT_42242 [Collybiopsis luxurians FD-317 M1]|uniref:Unplaced genomic scaffold GYMLUscaffold_20, whole genome shotgun sequence n=1 Tax=Collybiopsis luxurians FD-317 M1 TaxID=944289 RepID=A0A0D0D038_9AGAR|nr:hypothetical protein GYMLUDRAFT_42242 [Collybiopsis luxurians FD-317 M1]
MCFVLRHSSVSHSSVCRRPDASSATPFLTQLAPMKPNPPPGEHVSLPSMHQFLEMSVPIPQPTLEPPAPLHVPGVSTSQRRASPAKVKPAPHSSIPYGFTTTALSAQLCNDGSVSPDGYLYERSTRRALPDLPYPYTK